MLTNLFSMFDPSVGMLSFSWFVIFSLLFFLPCFYWLGGTSLTLCFSFFHFVSKEVSYSVPLFIKGFFSFISSIFVVIFFYNVLALFPFVFCATSHMLVTLPLSFSFWLGVILFSWSSSFKMFLAHLVPSGTPLGLMSFMVLVELLSNLIRPLALTFRLTANMMAGHLLMSLVGGFLISLPVLLAMPGFFLQSLLVSMELGVSLVQAYVFSTLLLLYFSEGLH